MKYIGENAIKKLISLIKGDLATKQSTITASGLLKGDGTGTITAADTQEATLVDVPNGLLKGDGNTISAAVAGTDYVAPDSDGSNVTAAFTAASSRENIATGENLGVLFGKIAKWFSDLGSLAFKSSVTKSDVGLGNVDNVKQYSASNPPPYPVTSVNGQTGDVTVQSGSEAASYTATLTTSGWAQSGDRYSQTVNVTGVTASTPVVLVDVALSGTDVNADAAALEEWGIVSANNVEQGNGRLTFYALSVPSVNVPVNVGVC